jgi:eukaryotic-like serine/threonine-protein kinase
MVMPERDMTLTAAERPAALARDVRDVVAGTLIGRYLVERRLGAGGMGVVYAARDTELRRDVALKLMRPRLEVDAMQARLRREAQAMARLSHPNVVPVFDIGTHDGQLFLAMELVAGDSLRSWVPHPRPWPAVVALFIKAGRGLVAAHTAGLLHHDFKPDNVMVGRGDVPRITDFGLARELDDTTAASDARPAPERTSSCSPVAASGHVAGTPTYMAPEQLLGHPGGVRADQFSFCVSLYEVLYGARPFQPGAASGDGLLDEIRAGRISKPTGRGVPGWLRAAIVRGLAFDLEQRWGSLCALVDALERGIRRRRRRVAIGLAAALVSLATASGIVVVRAQTRDRDATARCADVALKANDATTILVCRDEYVRTNDPRVGAELANALRRAGKLADAATVARELLATPIQADALYTLGKIAIDDGRRDDAERALGRATELHRAQQRWVASATDLQALAGISHDFVDQLVGFDQAIRDARLGHDARIEAFCHLSAAELLSKIAAGPGARTELDRAAALLSAPVDLAQLELARGNVAQNLGDNVVAAAAFTRARVRAAVVPSARFARSARLNLVYSLAESEQLADASRELAAAAALDPDDRQRADRLTLDARIARRGGDPERAAASLERAIAATDPGAAEDLLELEVERAQIALAGGKLATAEQAARRAIGRIEALRSTHPPVELRAWMTTDWRAPYELWFAALARRGDAAGALAVFDHYRGLGVLAGLIHLATDSEVDAAPRSAAPALAFPIAELAQALPLLQASALATPAPAAPLGTASLLVLVVASDELWRISAEAGRLEVASLGRLDALRPRLEQLRAAPGDRMAAAALGALLVPAALARPSERVLHVVLDEPLAGLPVAALQIDGRRLGAMRPIVRAARPSDLGCVDRPSGRGRVVVIDARAAHASGRAGIAESGWLGGASRGDLLRVTVPIERDALVFADRRVGALEIAGRRGSIGRVVLEGAAAGPGGDAATGTALAMAFVAAGADQVIAAVVPGTRAAATRLTEQLLRADATDLARALARLLAAADPADADAALGLSVFGRATCRPSP